MSLLKNYKSGGILPPLLKQASKAADFLRGFPLTLYKLSDNQ